MDERIRLDVPHQFGDGTSIAKVQQSPKDRPAGQPVPEANPLGIVLIGIRLWYRIRDPTFGGPAVDADDIVPGWRGEARSATRGSRPRQARQPSS